MPRCCAAFDGSAVEQYATGGLRNSVGFDWAPWSGELFATDNGRDLLGDDFPPCELNRIVAGGFYGWPFINGDGVPDPDMGAGDEALLASALSPAHGFRAHRAARHHLPAQPPRCRGPTGAPRWWRCTAPGNLLHPRWLQGGAAAVG